MSHLKKLDKKMNRKYILNAIATLLVVSFPLLVVADDSVNAVLTKYETILSTSRIIYTQQSEGEILSVKNPQEYPVLIQSVVLDENKSESEDYVVTPPVFRLDANKTNKLDVISSSDDKPNDREKLNWLCVKSIPPKNDDAWMNDSDEKNKLKNTRVNLQLSLNNCIKIIYRPDSLKESPAKAAGKVAWKANGETLRAVNDSPYYINIASIDVDGNAPVKIDYVPPFGTRDFLFKKSISGAKSVRWNFINDYGGKSDTLINSID